MSVATSPSMKEIADALELLLAQHVDITTLLADLPDLDGERFALGLGALADKIATHLVAEAELRKTLHLAAPGDDRAIQRALASIIAHEHKTNKKHNHNHNHNNHNHKHTTTQKQNKNNTHTKTNTPDVLED